MLDIWVVGERKSLSIIIVFVLAVKFKRKPADMVLMIVLYRI